MYSTFFSFCFADFQVPRRHGATDNRGRVDLRGRQLYHVRAGPQAEDEELGEAGEPVPRGPAHSGASKVPVPVSLASRRQH